MNNNFCEPEKLCLPLVSAIIPVYNHEKYVQDALQSIISQTYANIELLLIDDGSSDNSWVRVQELRDKCEKRFARVEMHTRPNKGLRATYNELLASAQGQYIFIVNSDDKATPEVVSSLVRFLEQNEDYAAAVAGNEFIDDNGTVIYRDADGAVVYDKDRAEFKTYSDFLMNFPKRIRPDDFGTYAALLEQSHIPNGYVICKWALDKIGGYSTRSTEEDRYIFTQISKFSKIKFIDKILFYYRWHSSNTLKNRKSKEKLLVAENLYYEKTLVDAGDDVEVKRIFYKYFNKRRYVFKTPVLAAYVIRNKLERRVFLEFFGKSIQFYYKQRYKPGSYFEL